MAILLLLSFLTLVVFVKVSIAIFKEFLILLKDKALKGETELVKLMYEILYVQMFQGYLSVNDFANAVECGRELLVFANETGDRNQEGMVYFNWGNCTISTVNIKKQKRSLKRQGIST